MYLRVVGLPAFFVSLLIFVWAGHSCRATNLGAVLVTALWTVEGYCTPDEAMVCQGRCADCCEPEPLLGKELSCGMA